MTEGSEHQIYDLVWLTSRQGSSPFQLHLRAFFEYALHDELNPASAWLIPFEYMKQGSSRLATSCLPL